MTKWKLVELTGGPLDGRCVRIPSHAPTIAIPVGRGRTYKEFIYTQDEEVLQCYVYQCS